MWACIWYSAQRLTSSQAHKLQRTENSAVNTPTRRRGQGCGYFCSRASAGEKRYWLLRLFISIKRRHLAARELKDRTASYGFHVSNTCCSHDDICEKKGFLAIFLTFYKGQSILHKLPSLLNLYPRMQSRADRWSKHTEIPQSCSSTNVQQRLFTAWCT